MPPQVPLERLALAGSEVEFSAAVPHFDMKIWPGPVVDLFAQRTDVGGVLKRASSGGRCAVCDERLFIGEWQLLQGRRSEVRASLERRSRECHKFMPNYLVATPR
jgi:hypothetical protein